MSTDKDMKIKQIVPATPGYQLVTFECSNTTDGGSHVQIRASPVLLWALCTDEENPEGMVYPLAPFPPEEGGTQYMYPRKQLILCQPGDDPNAFALEAEHEAERIESLRANGERLTILDTKGNPIARRLAPKA